MPIALNFCISESDDAKSFTFKETTGIYDAISNTGGWGSPNPTIASALTATVSISKLEDVDKGIYTNPVSINVYPTLPNTNSTLFLITAETAGFGVNSSFIDGIYKITYNVTSSSGLINPVTKLFGFYSNLDCCIKKASDKVSLCSCNCDELEEEINDLIFWRRLLKASDCCGNIQAIVKYIEKINTLCNSCNCN